MAQQNDTKIVRILKTRAYHNQLNRPSMNDHWQSRHLLLSNSAL
jgi:hypothetical protein